MTLKKPTSTDSHALRIEWDYSAFLSKIATKENADITTSVQWLDMEYYSLIRVHATTGIVKVPPKVFDVEESSNQANPSNVDPNSAKKDKTYEFNV